METNTASTDTASKTTRLVEIYRRDIADLIADINHREVHRDRNYLLGIISRCHGVMLEHELSEIDEQTAYDRICDILTDA